MKIKGLRAKVPRQVPKAWKLLDGSRFAAGTWGDGISRPLTEEWLVYLDELAFLLASATPYWEWLAVWSKVPCRNETAEIARQQFLMARYDATMLRVANAWVMSQEYAYETSGVSVGWATDGYQGAPRAKVQSK